MINYVTRRQTLAKNLLPDSIAIIPGSSLCLRNGDVHYRFRQDSDFYYLTGLDEPDALLMIFSKGDSILFLQEKDPTQEQWNGPRLGTVAAVSELSVQQAFDIQSFSTRCAQLLVGCQQIYYPIGKHVTYQTQIYDAWVQAKGGSRRGTVAPEACFDLNVVLSEMRLFKEGAELSCLKEAARCSILGHQHLMRTSRTAQFEYELEAAFLSEVTRQGCRELAYDAIVAAGNNACTLHYVANNQKVNPDDLILVDAGAEYQHYAADITRTFPASGRFSIPQKRVYEWVLKAQRAGIAAIKPGVKWHEIQTIIVRILTEGLIDLGILKGNLEALIEQEAYKPFYMHSSGHWLGLDVHDVGAYKVNGDWRALEPGMVLTVEPGLYFSKHLPIDDAYKGIGIRIEDDIHVTQNGYENLTADLPVTVADLEAYLND